MKMLVYVYVHVHVYVYMYTYLHGGDVYLRTECSIKSKRMNERMDLVQFRNYGPEYVH